jgi:hypothetical protein
MRILIAIPCLFGAEHTKLAIQSVVNSDVDLLLIDNGAANDVKAVIYSFEPRSNVWVIRNKENIYVNPAWNQIMEYFNSGHWSHLILMNSDLIMGAGWKDCVENFLQQYPQASPVPNQSNELEGEVPLYEGIAGVFVVLSRYQVGLVYPIPNEIKVWFGDNWIYDIIRAHGFSVVVHGKLMATHYHNGSQNVSRVPGISEIIEADKVAWQEIVLPLMKEKINHNRELI